MGQEREPFLPFWDTALAQLARYRKAAEKEDPPGEMSLSCGALDTIRTGDRTFIDQACKAVKASLPRNVILNISGNAIFDIGDEDDGLKRLREAASLRASQKNRQDLAARLAAIDEHIEALDLYRRLLEDDPGDAPTLVRHAWVLLNLGEWEEAEESCRQALEASPTDGQGRFALAQALEGQGRFAEAVKEYKKARRHGVRKAQAHFVLMRLGLSLLLLGEPKKAKKAAKRALALEPGYKHAVALLDYADGDEDPAVRSYYDGYPSRAYHSLKAKAARGECPDIGTLLLGSMESIRTKDRRHIEEAVEAVRGKLPEDTVLHILAETKCRLGETAEGIALMRQAVALSPTEYHLVALAANLFVVPGSEPEARKLCEEVLAKKPGQYCALLNLAWIEGREDLPKGLEMVRRASQDAPYDADAHLFMGQSLVHLGRYEEAIEEFRRVLAFSTEPRWCEEPPMNVQAWAGIADCYAELGDGRRARLYAEWALRKAPSYDYAKQVLDELEEDGDTNAPARADRLK